MFTRETAPKVLTDEQLDAIHAQGLRLLAEVGTDVLQEDARKLLEQHGCRVDGDRVYWDSDFVLEQVAKAPASFRLKARNPERSVVIGDGSPVYTQVGGSPFVSDLDQGRRSGTIADHDRLVKVSHAADVLTCMQSGTVEPMDLPPTSRHLDVDISTIRWSDKPYVAYGTSGPKTADAIELATIVHGGRAAIEAEPVLMVVVNPNSPLIWDTRMVETLVTAAEANQPIVVTPFLLAGGTAPVSLAGGLSLEVAETLSGVALAQTVRPGVGCLLGSFYTPLDMRTGSPAFGMPEAVLAILAGRQLADRYDLPYRGGGAFTSANSVDAQAASESVMSLWGTMLAGTDFVLHAAGWLEGGLTASLEKLALDVEILRIFERMRQGIPTDDEAMAYDAIAEAGPGGMFLASPHTMNHFRDWLYMSPLFRTTDFAAWEQQGAPTGEREANAAWKRMLESYEDPGLDDGVRAELDAFVAKRKQEIPDFEE
jgi:trimethylamine--corrinoid protein Co-methyltransferase